jgi:tetratricopeptide (TPR) repeat protein
MGSARADFTALPAKLSIESPMNRLPAFVLVSLLNPILCAAQNTGSSLADGLRLIEEGRTTLEEKPLTDAKGLFTHLTQTDSGDANYFCQLARVGWYLVDAYESHQDKKSAEHALDDAIAAVQHAISLNDKSADAHALLGDLYGRKISFGGFMAGPRYGPKAGAEEDRALALDANDPRVYASLGRKYLEAPKMFGGDVDKAIANFLKATQLDPGFDENFVWLTLAYRKKGDAAKANQALQDALRLNPRSVFAKNAAGGK